MNNQEFLKHAINIKQESYFVDGSNPTMAIIDVNWVIQYSSNDFDEYFNKCRAALSKPVLTLHPFKANYTDIESILIQTVAGQKKSKIIIFIKNKDIVHSHLIEFLPIINPTTKDMAGISLVVQKYQEHGLLFQRLKQKSFSMGVKLPKRSINYVNDLAKLTQFQMAICYLVVHNYPNEHIAAIINLLDEAHGVKNTSRASINKQIDKIREIFELNSKTEIIDFLTGIDFYNYLPSILFKDGIIVLD